MNKPKIRFKGFEGEWKERKFGDFGHVEMCKRIFKYQTSSQGEIPFYKIGTFGFQPDAFISRSLYEDYRKKFSYPKKGDILISAAGTIGRTIEYKGEECYYQDSNIVWLNHNEEIDNAYLKQLYSLVTWSSLEGATIKRLYNSNILNTHFNLPSLPEQRAIASYFTSLDAQIAASTSRLSSLKQIKAASLLNMFPQKGETVPRVRFKGFQGEWDSPSIEDVFEIRNGYTPSKSVESYWIGGTIPWFRMEDIRVSGGFLEDSIQHITPQAVKNNGLFEKGSIIMATTATIGVHAQLIADSLANQRFTNLKIRKSLVKELSVKFFYYYLFIIDEWCKANINLSNFASVDMTKFNNLQIPIPPLEEQNRIVAILDRFDTLTNDLTSGLPAEMEKRRQQYEYYRDKLLTFKRKGA